MDTLNPEFLFRQTAAQMRRNGARGGRATARNRRNRRPTALILRPHTLVRLPPSPGETTVAAIAALDAQFPWLRAAETRCRPEPNRRA
jgi:hypothetical protein